MGKFKEDSLGDKTDVSINDSTTQVLNHSLCLF